MRKALDILKAKWQEAEGDWAMLDFMEAGLHPDNEDNWIRIVVKAEQLSQPYVDAERSDSSARVDA